MKSAFRHFWAVINRPLPQSRNMLQAATTRRAKAAIIAGIITQSLVSLIFCAVFVIVFVALLGQENAIVGVVVLLSVLTFQKVHFGYNSAQGAIALFGVFAIYAVVPPLVTALGGIAGALLMAISLFIILVLSCDHVAYHNHVILVLSFLLLYGYPASPSAQPWRFAGLLAGGLWAASILVRKNQHDRENRTISDVFADFSLKRKDDQWKVKLAILVPFAMLCGHALGLERDMWIGIAAMSVLSPYHHLRGKKMLERFVGTVLGTIVFYLFTLIPGMTPTFVGLAGGFLVGLTTSYRYQTVFNSLGALSVAMLLMGPNDSILMRIADNAFAIIFIVTTVYLIDLVIDRCENRGAHRAQVERKRYTKQAE